jgi:NAD+ synthase
MRPPLHLPGHAEGSIHQFLQAHVDDSGSTGIVVGLSGGIDSALVARLARDALGAQRVLGVLLPDRDYPDALLAETQAYARDLGIAARVVPIDPAEAALRSTLPEVTDRLTWGNAKARLRMIVLYSIAREEHRLVVGTGNKSELLLGYFTKYGDGGVDLLPLGDLYKTQVYQLAERLGLPEPIRARAPTAGLYEGQTDEAELGMPYQHVDQVLRGIEELLPADAIVHATGLPEETVRKVEARVLAFRHKRRLPPIPKLSLRTLGLDWRD